MEKQSNMKIALSRLGPGFIIAATTIGAGSIVSFTNSGANFGFNLLWWLIILAVSLYAFNFAMKKYTAVTGVVSLKRLLNQSNLKSWSSKMIKKSLEAYFFTLKNKIVFCKKQFQNMSVFCFVSTEIV